MANSDDDDLRRRSRELSLRIPPRPSKRFDEAPAADARHRLPSHSDGGEGDRERERDERFLRAIAQVEGKLLSRLSEVKEEVKQEARSESERTGADTKGEKGEPGKSASLVSNLPAILVSLAGLVTAIGAFTRKDSDESAKVYTELKTAVEKQNDALAKNTANDEARWNWIAGFVKSLPGVKVVESPGAPPIEPLDLAPSPRQKPGERPPPPTAAPIQVRVPLPAPLPSSQPVKLPSPEKLFGDKKP